MMHNFIRMKVNRRNAALVILMWVYLLGGKLFAQDTSQYVVKENFKREIVIDGKRYRVYNNWITFGAGPMYHSENPRTQFSLGLDFHFHIKKVYLNVGGVMSGDQFGIWNNYTGHVGWIPWRKESEVKNMAAMAGFSYSQSYKFIYAGHYESNRYEGLGLYAQFEYTMKLQYAVGLGTAFFVDWNKNRFLIGVRLDGYLSGAYRGYVRGMGPKH